MLCHCHRYVTAARVDRRLLLPLVTRTISKMQNCTMCSGVIYLRKLHPRELIIIWWCRTNAKDDAADNSDNENIAVIQFLMMPIWETIKHYMIKHNTTFPSKCVPYGNTKASWLHEIIRRISVNCNKKKKERFHAGHIWKPIWIMF